MIFFSLYHLRCLTEHLLILINNVLCYCKAINNDGNEWLLLDVNPKTKFSDMQKSSKGPKKNFFQKNLPSDLVIKLLILFVILKILWLIIWHLTCNTWLEVKVLSKCQFPSSLADTHFLSDRSYSCSTSATQLHRQQDDWLAELIN